jgi:hypothetical protein
MLERAIYPGDSDAVVSAWDIFTPLVVALIIALWPAGKHPLKSFGRTFCLSAAFSFLVYTITLALLYVLAFAGVILTAGISVLGLISKSHLAVLVESLDRELSWVFIIVAQLIYIWRAVRRKRQGDGAVG